MKILSQELTYRTQGHCDIVDISSDVSGIVARSGLKEGTVFVFVVGSTAGLTTCEYEPGLEQDIRDFFEKLILKRKVIVMMPPGGMPTGFPICALHC
jgi:thiamine phosphate synthase YjbQ (UPF0047 family)